MKAILFVRRHRRQALLLAAGAVAALAMVAFVGSSQASSSGFAWTRVGLDTPKSQLVKSAPSGADTLPWRASLLIHLMGTDTVQRQLAERLGVRLDEVAVVDPVLAVPHIVASMPKRAAETAGFTVAPYVVTMNLRNSSLPIISVEAVAPDRAGAARLARAAAAVLEQQSSTTPIPYRSKIKTGGGAPLTTQPFLVERVAPVRTKAIKEIALPAKQLGIPFVLFALWCAGVILLPRLLRRRTPRPVTA
jgi:hypothetical protein